MKLIYKSNFIEEFDADLANIQGAHNFSQRLNTKFEKQFMRYLHLKYFIVTGAWSANEIQIIFSIPIKCLTLKKITTCIAFH